MWLRRLDRRHQLYIAPFQWAWLLAEVGLTTAQCEEAAWAITPDGARYQGAAAISVILDQLLGGRTPFYTLYRVWWIQRIEDQLYRWIANHRSHFPGVTPAVQQKEPWQPE